MRARAFAALTLALALADASPADAYCRRTTPVWTSPIRVVVHPDMQNHIRHPFINPAGQPQDDFPCTSSAQCGTDGLCSSGHAAPAPMRCRGPRWTRAELERAVLWVVGRINNEVPADIPFMYVDLNDTNTCVIDEDCNDAARPWLDCIQTDTIVIMPSECDGTSHQTFNWSGTQWIEAGLGNTRNALIRLGWSGTPRGITWEHTGGHEAGRLPESLLHELGHALGFGHTVNDYPGTAPICVPVIAPSPNPHAMCPVTDLPPAGPGLEDRMSFGTCPIMNGAAVGRGLGLNQHFYGMDDINGFVALYGLDTAQDTRLYEDCDLGAGSSFFELPTADLPLTTDMATAPSLPLDAVGTVSIGGRVRSVSYQSQFQIFSWDWSSTASTSVAVINTPGFLSTGPVGVSASLNDRAVSATPIRFSGDHRHWMRRIRTVRRSSSAVETAGTFDPPDSQANPPVLPASLADTPTPGVSTAYHAPTDSWLHVIRDFDDLVLMVAWRGVTGTPGIWSNVVSLGYRSFATPSIACSPDRCFIATVEVPTPRPPFPTNQTRLMWSEGTVTWPTSGSQQLAFNFVGGINTSSYNVFSDPVAAVTMNPAGGWYFYVSVAAPEYIPTAPGGGSWGTRVLKYRRVGTNALSLITPLLPPTPGISVQPTAGATGVCAELFTSATP